MMCVELWGGVLPEPYPRSGGWATKTREQEPQNPPHILPLQTSLEGTDNRSKGY